jgi:hypothetical protein
MAIVIGTEGRIKHVQAMRAGHSDIFEGLDFWAPNINIFRDPRWGRGQETYGEDPFLTARMGVAFVTGMQGDDPRYYRVISTPKHFAVHTGADTPHGERRRKQARRSGHLSPCLSRCGDRGSCGLRDVRIQLDQWPAGLRQRVSIAGSVAGLVELPGLRGLRLRRCAGYS